MMQLRLKKKSALLLRLRDFGCATMDFMDNDLATMDFMDNYRYPRKRLCCGLIRHVGEGLPSLRRLYVD